MEYQRGPPIPQVLRPGDYSERVAIQHKAYWIQIHGLPLQFMTAANAICIEEKVGNIIEVENVESKGIHYSKYLRIKVEIQLQQPLVPGYFQSRPRKPPVWVFSPNMKGSLIFAMNVKELATQFQYAQMSFTSHPKTNMDQTSKPSLLQLIKWNFLGHPPKNPNQEKTISYNLSPHVEHSTSNLDKHLPPLLHPTTPKPTNLEFILPPPKS